MDEKQLKTFRVRDHIIAKLNTLAGIESLDHESGGSFYILAENVPDHVLNQALAATDDWVRRMPLQNPVSITKYFMGCVRKTCRDQKIMSGIKKWDGV